MVSKPVGNHLLVGNLRFPGRELTTTFKSLSYDWLVIEPQTFRTVVVVDGPFQTENGEQIGEPKNDIIRRYQPTAAAYLKKRYISVLLQIM